MSEVEFCLGYQRPIDKRTVSHVPSGTVDIGRANNLSGVLFATEREKVGPAYLSALREIGCPMPVAWG